jgi:hypothetical protein
MKDTIYRQGPYNVDLLVNEKFHYLEINLAVLEARRLILINFNREDYLRSAK